MIVTATLLGGDAARHAEQLDEQWRSLERVIAVKADEDVAPLLSNASAGLEAIGHLVVAWLWLEQEAVAQHKSGDFYDGKRAAASYFFEHELPMRSLKSHTVLDTLPVPFATCVTTVMASAARDTAVNTNTPIEASTPPGPIAVMRIAAIKSDGRRHPPTSSGARRGTSCASPSSGAG